MLPKCSVAVLPECSVAVHINVLHSHASLFAQCAIRSFVAIQTGPVQIGQGHRCALSHPRWPSLSPKVPVSTTVPHLSLRTGATLDQPPCHKSPTHKQIAYHKSSITRVLHSSHPYAQGSYKKGLLASCCLERRNGLGVCDDHQRVQPLDAVHVVTATS